MVFYLGTYLGAYLGDDISMRLGEIVRFRNEWGEVGHLSIWLGSDLDSALEIVCPD